MPEEPHWENGTMECGHQVETSRFYIDDDNIIRMKYVCEEGCITPWIKLGKAPLPHTVRFNSDPYENDYIPKPYVWNDISKGDIISLRCDDESVEDFEVVYKVCRPPLFIGDPRNILYFKHIGNGERVLVELLKDGSLYFMLGVRKPINEKGFQSWTEEEVKELENRVTKFDPRNR